MKLPNIPTHNVPLPPDHNGIIWLHSNREPEDNHVFNRPWMDNLNPQLLMRYWVKKGRPGYLFTWHAGVKLWHRYLEGAGTITFVSNPLFDQL